MSDITRTTPADRFVSRPQHTAQVYGHSLNPDRIHFPDGTHTEAGRQIARVVDEMMRTADPDAAPDAQLCPGCYMLAMFNALLYLARDNGQDPRELAATMGKTFSDLGAFLAARDDAPLEILALNHIGVVPAPLGAAR